MLLRGPWGATTTRGSQSQDPSTGHAEERSDIGCHAKAVIFPLGRAVRNSVDIMGSFGGAVPVGGICFVVRSPQAAPFFLQNFCEKVDLLLQRECAALGEG
jgi:hypothetical protein